MKKIIIPLLYIFSAFLPAAQAETILIGKGHVAHSPIEMELKIDDNGEVNGSYLYTKIKTPIKLKGELEGTNITLHTHGDLDIEETFKGNVIIFDGEVARISGKWFGTYGGYLKKENGYNFLIDGRTNPLSDENVTCDEMETVPELVFELEDLGSGGRARTDVDYHCPNSIIKLEFISSLIAAADEIRGTDTVCGGSIRHAYWRYYAYSLARLGYYPESYAPNEWKKLERTAEKEFFHFWSNKSVYNKKMYELFSMESIKAEPLLVDWFIKQHNISRETAKKYTTFALNRISDWAYGSFYSSYRKHGHIEPVPHTDQAVTGNTNEFLSALNAASNEQKISSLNLLLLNNADESLVRKVIDSLDSVELKERTETPLSNAVFHPSIIDYMLTKGFDANHQNRFGKTALFYAIQFNQHRSSDVLIKHGANVNHEYQRENFKVGGRDCSNIKRWGRTPLMHAAQHADPVMLETLIKAGADAFKKDVLNSDAIDYAERAKKLDNVNYLTSILENKK